MTTVVIFNAPPGAGKDEVVKWLGEKYNHRHNEFKKQLVTLAKAIYCIDDVEWERMYTREEKEKPQESLDGKTPREALIFISETVIKPNFGKDYFGKAAAKLLIDGEVNAFSDGGFAAEIEPVAERADLMYIIRIHRPGYTYEGDSRRYLTDSELTSMGIDIDRCVADVYNDSTLEVFFSRVEHQLTEWGVLNGKQNRSC